MNPSCRPERTARATRRRWGCTFALVPIALAAACGTDLVGPATTSAGQPAASPAASSTTTTLRGEVAVAFPVVACTEGSGNSLPGHGWKASILLAPIPTALVGRVEFYTDGAHSILGPSGWACTASTGSDGAAQLSVEPAGGSGPPGTGPPSPGTVGVFASFDTTGRPAGAALVCPYFSIPQWQQREGDCNGQKPPGEFSTMPTPDVASVFDPAGVTGTLAGSGGTHAVTGTVIFPQVLPAVTEGVSIDVATESCALTDAALCPTIVSDFDVREFPVPQAAATG